MVFSIHKDVRSKQAIKRLSAIGIDVGIARLQHTSEQAATLHC
ncbi:MAG: hypothetical protein JSC189_001152 [Candidatus Tokpelaia sp. JSC189]|nr:MAG: hypothetical protein JSC189_001152 [Candidatus Tokpelaia sp. JSC189]